MLLLLLCVVLQALSLSQGLNGTDVRPSEIVTKHADQSDKQIELSALSLSEGCFGVPRAFYKNTTVDVTLNLLDAQEKSKLALQICERLKCGSVFNMTAAVHNGTCLADCILRDSKLHNCTTAAKGNCMNATEVICENHAVQLVGGRDRCAGRVELMLSGSWGTVCDDHFDINSGHVVCAQLICGSATKVHFYGPGMDSIHISEMKCNGSESNLWECSSINTTASNYCGHKEDAGVVCSESVENTDTNTTELNMTTPVVAAQDVNDVDGACSGERRVHNVEINMDTIQKSDDIPLLTPLSFGAPDTLRQAVDMSDTSSTSSGEFYQNTKTDVDNILQSRVDVNDSSSTSSGEFYQNTETNTDYNVMPREEGPSLNEKSPYAALKYGDHPLPKSDKQGVDVNDSDSTSSSECYQNTEIDMDYNVMPREERPSLNEKSPYAPLNYGDNPLPNSDKQGVDVNDSDSTSSSECYQNTEIDMDSSLQCENEESPSLPDKSLQTPHSAQMTGNTAGYGGSHIPITHTQDGNDSDSTSSEECYQNTEINDNALHHYGEESPSLPEMSFQNPQIAQMTESTDGYGDHHVPRNLSQESDNSSTASEASYVNVPPKNESEDHSAASSESDYDEPDNW
ncbi:T-cell differentiation antigen CD6-like protein [Labeo rohita]|uniref:T-cell differentiation antigen CD6-like protein n=1 Tax=Labeo rohita TaxID=84645 RepID=A0A498LFJ8_LABRO|nr:T-cell differentiation antigen CD6-like protein [Labeo rohita]